MSQSGGAQFTPGPWEHKGYRVYRKGSYAVAWIEQQGPHSEWQANGKIIAAAPAMYEAIKQVIEHRKREFLDNSIEPYCSLVAALVQAEGRQG